MTNSVETLTTLRELAEQDPTNCSPYERGRIELAKHTLKSLRRDNSLWQNARSANYYKYSERIREVLNLDTLFMSGWGVSVRHNRRKDYRNLSAMNPNGILPKGGKFQVILTVPQTYKENPVEAKKDYSYEHHGKAYTFTIRCLYKENYNKRRAVTIALGRFVMQVCNTWSENDINLLLSDLTGAYRKYEEAKRSQGIANLVNAVAHTRDASELSDIIGGLNFKLHELVHIPRPSIITSEAEDEFKFKVGDRVMVSPTAGYPESQFGIVVKGHHNDGKNYYTVKDDDGRLLPSSVREDNLTLMGEPKFKIGDRVCVHASQLDKDESNVGLVAEREYIGIGGGDIEGDYYYKVRDVKGRLLSKGAQFAEDWLFSADYLTDYLTTGRRMKFQVGERVYILPSKRYPVVGFGKVSKSYVENGDFYYDLVNVNNRPVYTGIAEYLLSDTKPKEVTKSHEDFAEWVNKGKPGAEETIDDEHEHKSRPETFVKSEPKFKIGSYVYNPIWSVTTPADIVVPVGCVLDYFYDAVNLPWYTVAYKGEENGEVSKKRIEEKYLMQMKSMPTEPPKYMRGSRVLMMKSPLHEGALSLQEKGVFTVSKCAGVYSDGCYHYLLDDEDGEEYGSGEAVAENLLAHAAKAKERIAN